MKGFLRFIVAKVILLALASSFVSCHDLLFKTSACVAVDDANGVFVNGKFCKDPKYVKAEDFFTSELNIAGNTINRVGSNVTNVNVDKIPGLNTLEVSLVRIDFAPGGQKRNDTFSSERWEDECGCVCWSRKPEPRYNHNRGSCFWFEAFDHAGDFSVSAGCQHG
ncbi:hypothetical protein HID58_020067 [Brassica napus]|uniref:Cupin type-1 domain-containing protein n=3 Tax=Brassica napus TaxID=3708 RepID=A0ABQ8DEJ8_BRANA|nr:hypothetical protein HID58_020067 [Brassica napus]CDY27727.1 BnaA05g31360D [Brassica napus]